MGNQQGFVLLVVLVFLQLFSLLGLYDLGSATMELQANYDRWQRKILIAKANQFLLHLENNLNLSTATCLIAPIATANLLAMPMTWWQQVSCRGSGKDIQYFYLIESLGVDPCAIIVGINNNQMMIADYYRITFLLASDKIKLAKIRLQSTMTKPHHADFVCQGKLHRVLLGRQMWREI